MPREGKHKKLCLHTLLWYVSTCSRRHEVVRVGCLVGVLAQ